MKTVIITGSTGMIGGLVLQQCLNSSKIEKVISIGRRKTEIKNKKLIEVVHQDFLNFSSVKKYFKNVDIAYFCLGVYTGQYPDDKFKEITVDYTNAFADELIRQSPQATFCLLSGAGADRSEKSRISFARYKGMAENYLLGLGFTSVQFFRPNYIYPVTARQEPNLSYRLFRVLYPVMNKLFPNASITSEQLAKVIFEQGLRKQKRTFENNVMRTL